MNDHEKDIQAIRYERARKRVKSLSGFYKHLGAYLVVNAFLLALRYFRLDPDESFWSFEVFATAFFWGIGLAFHAFGVFYNQVFFGPDWEERKIRKLMDRDKNTKTWE